MLEILGKLIEVHAYPRRLRNLRRRWAKRRFSRELRVGWQKSRHLLPLKPDVTIAWELVGGVDYGLYLPSLGPLSIAYSGGIGDNIDFERALIKRIGLTVHAFDPTPLADRYLKTQNLTDQFVFHPIAFGNKDGHCAFRAAARTGRADTEGTLLKVNTPGAELVVPVHSIPTIMSQLHHDHLDILKMDIEGGEYEVLDHMLQAGVKPAQLTLEFHPSLLNLVEGKPVGCPDGWVKTAACVERLRDNGYRVFFMSKRGREYSFIHRSALEGRHP
jgi:FkbM family methyltransferase